MLFVSGVLPEMSFFFHFFDCVSIVSAISLQLYTFSVCKGAIKILPISNFTVIKTLSFARRSIPKSE